MARREVAGGAIRKWGLDSEGRLLPAAPTEASPQLLAARFAGIREISSQYGDGFVADFELEGGNETWGCPSVLYSKLKLIAIGTFLEIEYLGKAENKSGNAQHSFRVFTLEGKDVPAWARK